MRRTSVRHSVPQGQDREQVKRIVEVLCEHQQARAAAIAQLARATGVRLREAILADLPRLKREFEQYGKINIQDGTKGGRSGTSAPLNDGHCYQLERRLDQKARVQISYELGHGRIDVVSAYIGGHR
jgi:hypothetical protein